jgi:hypothetical protein
MDIKLDLKNLIKLIVSAKREKNRGGKRTMRYYSKREKQVKNTEKEIKKDLPTQTE